ncbi:MAG: glycosyltransferase [Planctomycetes bacterium]|nr:glycosyltransferase [Planctomycetota bacterium]
MFNKTRTLIPRLDRGPLRTMFVITSMPVGGAETLLVNLMKRLDRHQVSPELCCLKEMGPLGEVAANEVTVHSGLIRSKYDHRILSRMRKLIDQQRLDAVVTVGAGDKMFWGRLAAWMEGVPVILSALHSTGWPDTIGRLNRTLTPMTDGFIAVADNHGRHLIERERFPEEKVNVIPNGVDTYRFRALPDSGLAVRAKLGIPSTAPVCGIVAALRPEKNHTLFLRAAALTAKQRPDTHFVIVGDGAEKSKLERVAIEAGVASTVHFVGSRSDIPQVLSAFDVFSLTSHNEANPVSILEAMACEIPVVSTNVGSVAESVAEGKTGFLVKTGDAEALADRWLKLLSDRTLANSLGSAGRMAVEANWSLDRMVEGYERLICDTYDQKCPSVSFGDARAEERACRAARE